MENPVQLPSSSDIANGDTTVMNSIIDESENVFLPDKESDQQSSHSSGTLGYSNSSFNVSPPGGGGGGSQLSSSSGGTVAPTDNNSKQPTEGDLVAHVRQQLEYYFSKDNISSDKYLLSQMDGDHYVPISILASFNQVKRLTSDNDLLIHAIKESNVLQIDPTLTKVRAVPEKRCILILREIPKETPKEDIQNLFSGERCPKLIGCEFAENDCWYVTFSGEEDAQEAHRYLREEVREFHGNPIRARIKNMAAQRASSVPKPRPQYPYSMPMQPIPFYTPQSPSVGWSFFDPRYNPQYPNGFPPQPGFGGSQGGGGAGGRNYSVGSADRGDRRENVNREGMRRGSTGGSGGKRYDGEKRLGGGGGGSGYSGNRYRREDERIRNLPNRLRNKRNEEIGQTGSVATLEKGDGKDTTTDVKKDNPRTGTSRQQRTSTKLPQQKLDFAPGNFPPLPTSLDAVVPPPPPPPPAVSEEGNPKLADIVKGKKQDKGSNGSAPLSVSSDNSGSSKPIVQAPPTTSTHVTTPSDSKTLSVTTASSSSTTATSTTGSVSTSSGKNTKSTVDSKSTGVSCSSSNSTSSTTPATAVTTAAVPNSKDKNNNNSTSSSNNRSGGYRSNDKDTKFSSQSRSSGSVGISSSSVKGNNNSGNRPRHKDYKKPSSIGSNSNSTATTRQQKLSPVATKRSITSPPPEQPIVTKDDQESESVSLPPVQSPTVSSSSSSSLSSTNKQQQQPEKLSYAQMAQQKPKPSPQKQSKGPPSSPPASTDDSEVPPSSPPDSSSPPPTITNTATVATSNSNNITSTAVNSTLSATSTTTNITSHTTNTDDSPP